MSELISALLFSALFGCVGALLRIAVAVKKMHLLRQRISSSGLALYVVVVLILGAFSGILLDYGAFASILGGYAAWDLMNGYYTAFKKTKVKVV